MSEAACIQFRRMGIQLDFMRRVIRAPVEPWTTPPLTASGARPTPEANQLRWQTNRGEFETEDAAVMVWVLEYGENIGTLRNLFRNERQAICFAKHIMELSENEYTCIATNKWYCAKKDEYVEIEGL